MEASPLPVPLPPSINDKIRKNLLKNGVPNPSPKIIHTLRKKHAQKALRKKSKAGETQVIDREAAEEAYFQDIKSEYRSLVGNPWEGLDRVKIREIMAVSNDKDYEGVGLKREHLRELGEFLGGEREKFKWLLDDDVEIEEGWAGREKWVRPERKGGEAGAIRFLVDKLSSTELTVKDYKFTRMMRQSELQFTENQLLKIVGGLGDKGQWRHALSVVEWVYSSKEHKNYKSRFVYTKLLAVLGKARRPHEALKIFNVMLDDAHIYPDMPAYHSIAVTLGQAGYLKELIKVIESLREKPSKRIKNMRHKNWDLALQPDIVVFNAVLNACVSSRQWKGVSWVFQQLRKHSLKPNGPTYGLAMEVMLNSGKYELVHEFFEKMKRSGEAPKALTYKVLVKALWEEGEVDKAVEAVRDMEQRGVVGVASVYYELACCLCKSGRWQEAMDEVIKMKSLTLSKPLQVTFTGMILSSLARGHIHNCISIYEQSKDHCSVDIGLINAMLKVYGTNDMFSEAKQLFEEAKMYRSDSNESESGSGSYLSPDAFTYTMMLKASANAQQWEYFEFVYRDMILTGFAIDQTKHATLLVEASRAGKLHLLEHAFDTLLEAGEIPHVSVCTELICQAIINMNFEKVTSLISALAYAPSQISEKQWSDLFVRNSDRMSRDNLIELLETVTHCELPSEATVSNLQRSLALHLRYDVDKEDITIRKLPSIDEDGKLSSDENICTNTSSVNSLVAHQLDDQDVIDITSRKGNKMWTTYDDSEFGEIFGETDDDSDDEFSTSYDTDADDKLIDRSSQPSASEILESWKQHRDKNGAFWNFSIGPGC